MLEDDFADGEGRKRTESQKIGLVLFPCFYFILLLFRIEGIEGQQRSSDILRSNHRQQDTNLGRTVVLVWYPPIRRPLCPRPAGSSRTIQTGRHEAGGTTIEADRVARAVPSRPGRSTFTLIGHHSGPRCRRRDERFVTDTVSYSDWPRTHHREVRERENKDR